MTVRVYRSSDAGAPVFSNTLGSILGVLDACLVNGYGSGPTAKAPLGWSITFTATNKRTYRMAAGTRNSLANDASGATYALYNRPGVHMTPATANHPLFDPAWNVAFWPTDAQSAVAWSLTNNTAGDRPWMLVGDEKGFILFNQHNNTNALTTDTWAMNMFGDFTPYNPNETGNCYYAHGTTETTAQQFLSSQLGTALGHWTAQEFTGHGQGVKVRLYVDPWVEYGVRNFGNPLLYSPAPNPNTNNFDVSRVYVVSDYFNNCRGHLRGLWCPMHSVNVAYGMNAAGLQNGDQIVVAGPTGSRVLEYRRIGSYTQYACFVEVSDTWDL